MSKFTAVTMFAGIGSSSKACRDRGGYVYAIEREDAPAETLLLNGFNVIHSDVRGVDYKRFGKVDVIIGGPPCQPFSPAGRNAGQDDERDMMGEAVRAVREAEPEFFIFENTRGLAGPRHKDYLDYRVTQFEECGPEGYIVEVRVLDAADYGVPQSRKRTFILGRKIHGVYEDNGTPVHQYIPEIRWPRKHDHKVTMAAALGWDYGEAHYRAYESPAGVCITEDGGYAHRWVWQRPSTTVVGSFRPEVQAAPGYRSTGDGPRQNAPGSVVTTVEERLVLQQLPRDWKISGGFDRFSKARVDLQVGNSVPCGLIRDLLAVNGF